MQWSGSRWEVRLNGTVIDRIRGKMASVLPFPSPTSSPPVACVRYVNREL